MPHKDRALALGVNVGRSKGHRHTFVVGGAAVAELAQQARRSGCRLPAWSAICLPYLPVDILSFKTQLSSPKALRDSKLNLRSLLNSLRAGLGYYLILSPPGGARCECACLHQGESREHAVLHLPLLSTAPNTQKVLKKDFFLSLESDSHPQLKNWCSSRLVNRL